MDKQVLKAEKRVVFGRKVKTVRQKGIVPANVFGKKIESLAVQVDKDEFKKVYKETGETGLIDLIVGADKKPVLVHNLQLNPLTEEVLHVDFIQVDLKEKISAEVPVELVGESPAEKQGLGTVVLLLNEIEVEALPTDLPENFQVDASTLTEVDQVVAVKDIKVDSKVTLLTDPEQIVVKVEPLRKEEEIAPVVEEVPVEGAETTGETPVESTEAVTEETPAE